MNQVRRNTLSWLVIALLLASQLAACSQGQTTPDAGPTETAVMAQAQTVAAATALADQPTAAPPPEPTHTPQPADVPAQAPVAQMSSDTLLILGLYTPQKLDPVSGQPLSAIYRLESDGRLLQLVRAHWRGPEDGFDVSPDGQWLVYAQAEKSTDKADLFKVRLNGSELTRLTNTPDLSESWPQWSSDGARINYVASGAEAQLTQMRASGGDPIPLGVQAKRLFMQSWSPDGKWVAYVSQDEGGPYQLFLADAEGKKSLRLGQPENETWKPRWSPDSSRLAYSATEAGQDHTFLYDLTSGQETRLPLDEQTAWNTPEAWSPDGQTLILEGQLPGASLPGDVFTYSLATGQLRNLTEGPRFRMEFTAFDPQGQQMLLAGTLDSPGGQTTQAFLLNMADGVIFPIDGLPTEPWTSRFAYAWRSSQIEVGSLLQVSTGVRSGAALSAPVAITGQEPTLLVTAGTVNVRGGPTTDFDVLGRLVKDDSIQVLGISTDGKWLQVRYDASLNGVGWLSAEFTNYKADDLKLPVVEANPVVPISNP